MRIGKDSFLQRLDATAIRVSSREDSEIQPSHLVLSPIRTQLHLVRVSLLPELVCIPRASTYSLQCFDANSVDNYRKFIALAHSSRLCVPVA